MPAFREQRVADIVLPQDHRVGINLFAKPTLATAWVLKASWKNGQDILYRNLKNECQGHAPYFCSKSYWGTMPDLLAQGFTLDPLPSAVYCVPYQAATESEGAAKLTHLLGDAKLLAPPRRGPAPRVDAPFEHKAGIAQGLHLVPCEQVKPLWRQQLRQTPALCPRKSKVPRRLANLMWPPLRLRGSCRLAACTIAHPALLQPGPGNGVRRGTSPLRRQPTAAPGREATDHRAQRERTRAAVQPCPSNADTYNGTRIASPPPGVRVPQPEEMREGLQEGAGRGVGGGREGGVAGGGGGGGGGGVGGGRWGWGERVERAEGRAYTGAL